MKGFQEGELIGGRYKVMRRLGKGGMGMVYEVSDTKENRRLALKSLLPQYVTNKKAVMRFIKEVNVVRQLKHPCIVEIYDARQLGELLYYTMEYIEGKSLRAWMTQKGRFGMGSTVRVLSLLCHALEHAHQYTVHRDISPENVMVMANGNVKLLDFGLAKLNDNSNSFTRVGVSLGKIQYSAPEQRADAKNVDRRADLYSLGVMFYEMLSTELPMSGASLTSLVPELPQEADTFVQRAIAPEPEARFNSATEFREALMRVYALSKQRDERPVREEHPIPVVVAAPEGGFIVTIRNAWERLRKRFAGRRN